MHRDGKVIKSLGVIISQNPKRKMLRKLATRFPSPKDKHKVSEGVIDRKYGILIKCRLEDRRHLYLIAKICIRTMYI